jgi:integrase/recombinase XerC
MIEKFLNYLKYERNRSAHTVEGYSRDLRAFETYFKHLSDQLSWESIDSDVIRDWMESMMDKGNTATSVNRRLSSVRSLYRFALSRKLVENDPSHGITGPKRKKLLPQYLRESEMDTLLDEVLQADTFEVTRARTIIYIFYATGIRLSELTGLDDASVDFTSRQIKVHGKRNKERIVPFGDELFAELQNYVEQRDREVTRQDNAFLVTNKGIRMTPQQVRNEVRRQLTKVTSLKKRSPHVLRHTFATAMLNHSAGIENVKKLLGHESISTTEIYTHTTFEQLKSVYAKAHPRK